MRFLAAAAIATLILSFPADAQQRHRDGGGRHDSDRHAGQSWRGQGGERFRGRGDRARAPRANVNRSFREPRPNRAQRSDAAPRRDARRADVDRSFPNARRNRARGVEPSPRLGSPRLNADRRVFEARQRGDRRRGGDARPNNQRNFNADRGDRNRNRSDRSRDQRDFNANRGDRNRNRTDRSRDRRDFNVGRGDRNRNRSDRWRDRRDFNVGRGDWNRRRDAYARNRGGDRSSFTRRGRSYDHWRSPPRYGRYVRHDGHRYRARPIWRSHGVPYAYRNYFHWGVGYYYPYFRYDYRRYVIYDWWDYYLPPPPYRHVWVLHDDGAYLVALATGLIVALALNDAYYHY